MENDDEDFWEALDRYTLPVAEFRGPTKEEES